MASSSMPNRSPNGFVYDAVFLRTFAHWHQKALDCLLLLNGVTAYIAASPQCPILKQMSSHKCSCAPAYAPHHESPPCHKARDPAGDALCSLAHALSNFQFRHESSYSDPGKGSPICLTDSRVSDCA